MPGGRKGWIWMGMDWWAGLVTFLCVLGWLTALYLTVMRSTVT